MIRLYRTLFFKIPLATPQPIKQKFPSSVFRPPFLCLFPGKQQERHTYHVATEALCEKRSRFTGLFILAIFGLAASNSAKKNEPNEKDKEVKFNDAMPKSPTDDYELVKAEGKIPGVVITTKQSKHSPGWPGEASLADSTFSCSFSDCVALVKLIVTDIPAFQKKPKRKKPSLLGDNAYTVDQKKTLVVEENNSPPQGVKDAIPFKDVVWIVDKKVLGNRLDPDCLRDGKGAKITTVTLHDISYLYKEGMKTGSWVFHFYPGTPRQKGYEWAH